jgi:hypothetical protein
MAMTTIADRLVAAFGTPLLTRLGFHELEFALRFELSDPQLSIRREPVPSFLGALDRARAIAAEAFQGRREVTALISCFGSQVYGAKERRAVGELGRLGRLRDLGAAECIAEDPDENIFRHVHAATIAAAGHDIDTLLWASAARETRIRPRARFLDVHIVDFPRRFALRVYDDRGMDVVAMDAEPLLPLYRRFGPWLLDHGRARMDATFAARH